MTCISIFATATPDFEQLAAMQSGGNILTVRRGSEPAKSLRSEYVSGNYFSTFGIGAFAGRMLTPADDTQGAAPAVVVSYQAWQSEYGSDPALVGATLYIQGQPVTVVGVAPPGFFGDRISEQSAGGLDSAGDRAADRRQEFNSCT